VDIDAYRTLWSWVGGKILHLCFLTTFFFMTASDFSLMVSFSGKRLHSHLSFSPCVLAILGMMRERYESPFWIASILLPGVETM